MIGKYLARRDDKKFGEHLQKNLVRLFAEQSAMVVRNDESEYRNPRSFDWAVATVATPELYFRFVRVRGQFEVNIAAPNRRPKWESLDTALLWLDIQQGIRRKPDLPNWDYGLYWGNVDWSAIDRFLVENWDRLKTATRDEARSD